MSWNVGTSSSNGESSSKTCSIVVADKALLNSFLERYYRALEIPEQIPRSFTIQALYAQDAEIVWNSRPFPTLEAFLQAIRAMPRFQYKFTCTQAQEMENPSIGGTGCEMNLLILVVVSGYLGGKDENVLFHQTFHLFCPSLCIDEWRIKLDRFCIF